MNLDEMYTNHPYFFQKEEDDDSIEYEFLDKTGYWTIYVMKEFNPKDTNFPVSVVGFTIDEYPEWLKELEYNGNEAFFNKYRVRMVANGERKPIANIVWFYSLKHVGNVSFYGELYSVAPDPNKWIKIERKYRKNLDEIKPYFEKERYTLNIKTEDNMIYFNIF